MKNKIISTKKIFSKIATLLIANYQKAINLYVYNPQPFINIMDSLINTPKTTIKILILLINNNNITTKPQDIIKDWVNKSQEVTYHQLLSSVCTHYSNQPYLSKDSLLAIGYIIQASGESNSKELERWYYSSPREVQIYANKAFLENPNNRSKNVIITNIALATTKTKKPTTYISPPLVKTNINKPSSFMR